MNGGSSTSAPTGCYKCGRPGHWSRDCPSNPDQNPTNPNDNPTNPKLPFQKKAPQVEKPKRVTRSRPKLTPELLLSDDGIGFVLKHFPKAFKYHGRGHEVKDLGNLLGLYAEWHSQLIPYYSFDQFVPKVEQVGTVKRVKLCLGELRERVANGGDITKLHDSPVEDNSNNKEEAMNLEEPDIDNEVMFNQKHDTDYIQEGMLYEIYDQATEMPDPLNLDITGTDNLSSYHNSEREKQISDEQKARMEANRLKALEKAVAPSKIDVTGTDDLSSSHNNSTNDSTDEASAREKQISDEQKTRMEANRLKALERAAARASSTQIS